MPHAMKRGQNNKYTYTARQSRTPTQADPSQKSQGRANSTQYWRISALIWALGTPIQQPSPTTGALPCSSVSSCRSTSRHLAPNCFVTRSFSPSPWRNYDWLISNHRSGEAEWQGLQPSRQEGCISRLRPSSCKRVTLHPGKLLLSLANLSPADVFSPINAEKAKAPS